MILNSFRFRLLLAFLGFSTLIVFVLLINDFYNRRKDRISLYTNELVKLQKHIEVSNRTINNFFTVDTRDTIFYQTNFSSNIIGYNAQKVVIQNQIDKLKELQERRFYDIDSLLNQLSENSSKHSKIFDSIIYLIKNRGFINEGFEGKMRDYAHRIEKNKNIDLTTLLNLRRAEKDYLLRNKTVYIQKHKFYQSKLQNQISTNARLSKSAKDSLLVYLNHYSNYFFEIIKVDSITGIYNNRGLKLDLSQKDELMHKQITSASNIVNSKQYEILKNYRRIYILIVLTLVALSIFTGYMLARSITRPISILSSRISLFVKGNFNEIPDFEFKTSIPEIKKLILNYFILKKEIISLIKDFKARVEERTRELFEKKELLEAQKEEIQVQNENLTIKNKFIEEQRRILELKNRDILDSINYAERIQKAMLPDVGHLDHFFSESFILHLPKDIISGDFYWIKHIKNQLTEVIIIAVADCTGHGVPGALMSMLGIATLNEVSMRKDVYSAAALLDALRTNVLNAFNNKSDESRPVQDGMDIGLCVFYPREKKLQFSGANRSIVQIGKSGFFEYRGDKMPIGSKLGHYRDFVNQEIKFEKGDSFYMFTDGYSDQFGGSSNKKIYSKHFKVLLNSIFNYPMKQQNEMLLEFYQTWKGSNNQIDDVLVLGFRLD